MSNVTAAAVRNYFRADEARMSRLSEAAQRTVREGARGRLHSEAVKAFNAKRRTDRRYVLGATSTATSEAKAKAAAAREALRAQGLKVGARGPLPKVATTSKPKARTRKTAKSEA